MSTSPALSLRREDLKDAKGEWVEKLVQSLTVFGRQTQDAFDRNISLLSNLNATLKTLDITTKDDWIAVTSFANGWQNYGSPTPQVAYRKRYGMTQIRGNMKSGTIGAVNAFLIPLNYKPYGYRIFATSSNNLPGVFQITSTGYFHPLSGSNLNFGTECIFDPGDLASVPNPIFPVVFKHGLKGTARPMAVLATDVLDVTDKASGQHVSTTVSWQVSGDSVRIEDLPELQPNRHYRVTFLVLGG
jgi:hypothetical protein